MGATLVEAGLLGPGLVRRMAEQRGVALPQLGPHKKALLFAAVAWIPLVVLSAVEGNFVGHSWVFSRDIGLNVRLLLVGPLLVAVAPGVERELARGVADWRTSELVPPDREASFDRFIEWLARMRRALWPEVATVVLAFALSATALGAESDAIEKYWMVGGQAPGPLSWAGWWSVLVSTPLFFHVYLCWILRYALWIATLVRLATLPPRVLGTHVDTVGGLACVAKYHNLFLWFSFGVSLVTAGSLANTIVHTGRDLVSLRHVEGLFVAFILLVFLMPLLMFSPLLVAARRRTVASYAAVAAHHAAHLEAQIEAALAVDQRSCPRLDSQLLSDEGNLTQSFNGLLGMKASLVSRSSLTLFALVTIGPLLPLELTAIPARDVLMFVKSVLL